MASSSDVIREAERQRLQDRREQERKDRELAERLFQEQFVDTPPRNQNRGMTRRGNPNSRGRRAGNNAQSRNTTQASTSSAPTSSAASSSRSGGGPIRRTAESSRRARRGAAISNRGRSSRRPQRNSSSVNGIEVQFSGDRVQVRHGNEVVDITAETYFPDDDDDSDYTESDDEVDERDDAIAISSSSESEPDEPERNNGARRGRGNNRAVNGDYIRRLLHPTLFRDNIRTDPLFRIAGLIEENDDVDDDDDDSDDADDEDDDDGEIEILDDSDDVIIVDEVGPIRAEPNHIRQPIFEEDRAMYHRELDLYHDDDEYQVPAAKVPTAKGKPVEPDCQWGDCTMCSNPPIKPKGCKKCLQFLGCTDCVRRWFEARRDSLEGPSCPLCRAPWARGPGALLMPTIMKNRQKESTSSLPASSSSTSSN